MYSGNLGRSHDLSLFLCAAERMKSEARLHFVVVGKGRQKEELEREVAKRGLASWTFLPWQPPELLAVSLGIADLSIVTVLPGAANAILPCKLFNYMAAGSAILGVCAPHSDVARIIEGHQCGYRIAPNDVEGLVRVIEDALESDHAQIFAANGQRIARERFSREVNVERLAGCILS
jgi:colanic acid biosynthesis glycosyl transferase WcaI